MLNRFVEESQSSFFQVLSDDDYFNSVKEYLQVILLSPNEYNEVLNPFLFRTCSLFFESIVARTLRFLETSSNEDEVCVLSAKDVKRKRLRSAPRRRQQTNSDQHSFSSRPGASSPCLRCDRRPSRRPPPRLPTADGPLPPASPQGARTQRPGSSHHHQAPK